MCNYMSLFVWMISNYQYNNMYNSTMKCISSSLIISQKFGSLYFGDPGNYSCNLGKVTCKGSQDDNSEAILGLRFINPFTIYFRSLSFLRIQVLETCTQGSMSKVFLHGSHGSWKVLENWKIVGYPWRVLEFSTEVLEYFWKLLE